MKFYITSEPYWKLNNVFTNLSKFNIINIDDIIDMYKLDLNKDTDCFLLNSEIIRSIECGLKSKKYIGTIYINSKLTSNVVTAIKLVLSSSSEQDVDVVLIDDYNIPKHKDITKLFDEIVYFPMYKKVKLIQCKPIIPKQKI